MSYTDLNGKRRRRRSARIQSRSLDTIPEALYQEILGYLLGDDIYEIFRKNYSLQFINKTFQRSFQRYLMTTPLKFDLRGPFDIMFSDYNGDHESKLLQLINIVKRYNVYLYDLTVDIYDFNFNLYRVMEAMHGINLSSLRKLTVAIAEFDLKAFKDCKTLTHCLLYWSHRLDDVQVEKNENFLSFNKHTLKYLQLSCGIIPKDLRSWPNLERLEIIDIYTRTVQSIESNTLQHLVLRFDDPCRMEIKCPNLKVLFIEIEDINSFPRIELKTRSCQPYDEDIGESEDLFRYTCHPSELRKIGVVVDVSDDCDIGIRID